MRFLIILVFGLLHLGAMADAASAANESTGTLYFAQITDTHLGALDHERVLADMVEAINAAPFPLACVVMTGDLFADNIGKPEMLAAATGLLGRIRVPVHVLAGNHDIAEKTAARDMALWTNAFGPLGQTADYGGVRFVFVYTEGLFRKSADRAFDAGGFLDKALREARGRPALVFHHGAWLDSYYNNTLHPGWPEDARRRWVARLTGAGNVKAVITGHSHRNELHWEGGLPVYICEPVARFWGRQPVFRIYAYRDGRLSYRTWYGNDAKRESAR